MGIARCLARQDKFAQAIAICLELAYPDKTLIGRYAPDQIARARLMLADLYSQAGHGDLLKELRRQLLNAPLADDPEYTPLEGMPTGTRVFVATELVRLAGESGLANELAGEIQGVQKRIHSELISLDALEWLGDKDKRVPQSRPEMAFRRMREPLSMYGFLYPVDGFEILCLQAKDKMADFWKKAADDFTDEFVFCRVYDDTGQQVAGEPRNFRGRELLVGTVFHTLDLKNRFDGWKVELYLRLGVFHDVAQRQRMIYIWVAILVIVLMLGSTVLASKAVLRQVRINRLKNDFIATVTHELKTPLSSMRVLVDTLLEGNYNDQKQATEYLQLISKENTRLSRLIDHFLTFSRMERNKQAFDMTKTAPAEIAEAAAQAVHARFNGGDCNFTLTVDDQLPSVMADKDAMVTVLVNLLDNAYKYSYDHKQIELRVFRQNDFVAFAVKDNGIGMSRRQMRKVFDHFYQADRSLARRVEGAGLGLSIVKFIVNAHKGQIDVESKPGKGSKFVVKIPVCNKANSLMSRFVK